jgi:hypothetical protein
MQKRRASGNLEVAGQVLRIVKIPMLDDVTGHEISVSDELRQATLTATLNHIHTLEHRPVILKFEGWPESYLLLKKEDAPSEGKLSVCNLVILKADDRIYQFWRITMGFVPESLVASG